MSSLSSHSTKIAVGVAAITTIPMVLHFLTVAFRKYRLLTSLPGPPANAFTTKGHEDQLREHGGLCKYLLALHAEYGLVLRLVLGGEVFVSVCDTKVLRELDIVRLDKRIEGLNFLRGLLGPRSVGLMKGQEARERRQLLHKLFTTQKLDVLVPHFVRCIRRDISSWSSSPSSSSSSLTTQFEAQEACRALWMRLNALNVFGPRYVQEGTVTGLGHVEEDAIKITEAFGEALNLLLGERYDPFPSLPFSARWRRRRSALAAVHEGVDRVIASHLARRKAEEVMEVMEEDKEEEDGSSDTKLSRGRKEGEREGRNLPSPSPSLARGGDLLSMLLDELERNPGCFSAVDVHDEMTTFLFATFENYVVLSNAMYMLSRNKGAQERVREEAGRVLYGGTREGRTDGAGATTSSSGGGEGGKEGGKEGGVSTLKEVQELVYAQCVVKETLRTVMGTMTWRVTEGVNLLSLPPSLAPSTASSKEDEKEGGRGIPPRAVKDAASTKEGGKEGGRTCLIPPDTSIIVPMVALHRNSTYWEKADEFHPERFLEGGRDGEKEGGRADPLAFIPFGLGTRRCLGHRFALDIASLVLAMVVDEYEIEGAGEGGGEEEEEVQWTESSFNWYVKDGLFLRLTPRRRK
ncbi:hypothetical protein VYU27_007292 [Nannochloropsis oceanica]